MKNLFITANLLFLSFSISAQESKKDSFNIEKEIISINELKDKKSARERSNEVNEMNSNSASSHMTFNDIINGTGSVRTYDLRYEGVVGSRYFLTKWSTGFIEFANGTIGKSLLKYNALDKTLLMYRGKTKDSLELYSYQLNAFALVDESNNSYVFRKYPKVKSELGTLPEAYLQVLSEGSKVNFLKLNSKRIKEADYKGAYSNDVRYDSFIDNSEYFIYNNETKKMTRFKRNKKSLVSALEENGFKVDDFISQNNLNFKNDTEIAKLIEHVNQN